MIQINRENVLLRVKLCFIAELNCCVSPGKCVCRQMYLHFFPLFPLLDGSRFCLLCTIFAQTKFVTLMFMMSYSDAAFLGAQINRDKVCSRFFFPSDV